MFFKKSWFTGLIVVLIWGACGLFIFELGTRLGPLPFGFRKLFYYKITSFWALEMSYVFMELHFFKFLLLFFSTLVLSIFTTFSTLRLIVFLACFNLLPVESIYLFYCAGKWDSFLPGSTEHAMLASIPVICIFSTLIAPLGCYTGTKFRTILMNQYKKQRLKT